MTKKRKIDLLYNKARGTPIPSAMQENMEIAKYRVGGVGDLPFVTRNNIAQYADAVDAGCRKSFYTWAYDNRKIDKRKTKEAANFFDIRSSKMIWIFFYCFWCGPLWGLVFYWFIGGGKEPYGTYCIAGAIISAIAGTISRKHAIVMGILFGGPFILLGVYGAGL